MGESLTTNDFFNDYSALYEALKIVSLTQNRLKHIIISLFATNKLNARQSILDMFSGSKTTKDLMKNTNLDSPNWFGTPLESLSAKMNNSMMDKPSPFVLRPKRSGTSSFARETAVKRSLPWHNIQNKKAKIASRPTQLNNQIKKALPTRFHNQRKFQKGSFRKGGRR